MKCPQCKEEILQYGRPTIRLGKSGANWSCGCADWRLMRCEE